MLSGKLERQESTDQRQQQSIYNVRKRQHLIVFYVKANKDIFLKVRVFVFKSQDISNSKTEYKIGSQMTFRLKSASNSETRLSGGYCVKNDLHIRTCTNILTLTFSARA